MLGIHDLPLFIASGLLLNITPGPDILYIVGRSSTQGLPGGVAAALGIGAGCLLHIAAAALGLSAVLATSATAFTVVKLIGAAYLLFVGLGMLLAREKASSEAMATPTRLPLRKVFAQGLLTNALNPKVALFFLAFLPQFIDRDVANAPLAFLFLGCLFNLNGTLWNLFVAWSTARVASGLARSRRATAISGWLGRCVGGLFVALGVRLALSEQG